MNGVSAPLQQIRNLLENFHRAFPEQIIFLFGPLHKGRIKPLFCSDPKLEKTFFDLKENLSPGKQFLTCRQLPHNSLLKRFCDHFHLSVLQPLGKNFGGEYVVAARLTGSRQAAAGKRLLVLLAEMIRFITDNAFLEEKLKESTGHLKQILHEMSVLHEISRSIDSSQNLDLLLHFIVQECMQLMNSEAGSLMLIVPHSNELEFKVALGPKSEGVKPFRVKIGKGISGWVAQHGEPILIPDAYADPRFDPSFDKRSGFRTKSYLCVPMTYKSRIMGVMTVLNRLDNNPFSESDKDLLITFATQAALAIENARLLKEALEKERLEKELQVAAEIQKHILPEKIPQIPSLDIAATYIPSQNVSGDFYDIIPLDRRYLVFVVADVSGKGVPGALVVANMQASLRAYFEYSRDMLSIINKLNTKIIANTTSDRFITFFFGLYDLQEHSFLYVNAGHNPPFLLKENNRIKKLTKGGIFLGMLPWQFESEKVLLQNEAILILYTDGLVEAMDKNEVEFGETRLKKLLKENRQKNCRELVDLIVKAVRRHTGDVHLQDDFTLVVLKRNRI